MQLRGLVPILTWFPILDHLQRHIATHLFHLHSASSRQEARHAPPMSKVSRMKMQLLPSHCRECIERKSLGLPHLDWQRRMISEGGSKKSVPDSTLRAPIVSLCLWLCTEKGCKRYTAIRCYQYYHQDTSGCFRHSYYVTMPRLRFVWPFPMSHNLKVSKLTSPKRRRVCVKLNGWDASWLWPCYHHWRFLGVWQPRPWKWGQTWGQLNPDRWNEWNQEHQEQEHIKLWQNDHNTSIKSIYVTHGKGIPIVKG